MAKTKGTSKFTPARRKIIIEAVGRGNYKSDAAALAGISARTIWHWLEKGREDSDMERSTTYARFYEDCQIAEAKFVDETIQRIRAHGKLNWTADMTLLERRFPDRFGQRQTVIHEGEMPSSVTLQIIGDPAARRAANELLDRLSSGEIVEGTARELGPGE